MGLELRQSGPWGCVSVLPPHLYRTLVYTPTSRGQVTQQVGHCWRFFFLHPLSVLGALMFIERWATFPYSQNTRSPLLGTAVFARVKTSVHRYSNSRPLSQKPRGQCFRWPQSMFRHATATRCRMRVSHAQGPPKRRRRLLRLGHPIFWGIKYFAAMCLKLLPRAHRRDAAVRCCVEHTARSRPKLRIPKLLCWG